MRSLRTVVLLFVVVVLAVFAPVMSSPTASGGTQSRVGVVIDHGNALPTHVDCVAISGDTIKAIDLLSRADIDMYTTWVESSFGSGRAVCWVDGEGRGTDSTEGCFGDPNDSNPDPFWGLWTQKITQAKPHEAFVGVSQLKIPARGLLYLTYETYPQSRPTAKTFKEVCSSA
jgi:hypothetical protein